MRCSIRKCKGCIKTMPCTWRLTFPSLWSMSLPLAPSLWAGPSPSVTENSTWWWGKHLLKQGYKHNISPFLWRYCIVWHSGGILSRNDAKQEKCKLLLWIVAYIGLLYFAIMSFSSKCVNTTATVLQCCQWLQGQCKEWTHHFVLNTATSKR